ncbi:Rne/Rng family ribonuclease [Rhodohalobacter barkolensis]|uniref:Ribonuclease E/G n=1 Tax=Rhodohalobacter barkolensis TaxID=2053187 RepID=A0A2N0VLI8_9BACT|nr:Rne/Rng family ribonuclease [Rhodohalobacter barkolensis]PKD45024.1 ribonuclease E/G [Rhodohalobacter barkolensis]
MKNQIIIHSSGKQTRVALLENGELAQLFIESEENQRTVGDIYLARVHKVMSGIRAAFIDVGMEKDAFLHFSDAGDHLGDYIKMMNGPKSISKDANKDLQKFDKLSNNDKQILAGKLLQNNQRILVQIVKEPIGSKGPRVSTDITIAGRFLVLIPMGNYIAISKKINNGKERRRLKKIAGDMLPDGFGVIIRTVAQGQDKESLEDDMRTVLKKWERILNKLENAKPPTLLYKDLDITESLIRDLFAKQYDRVLIDDYQLYKSIKSYVSQIAPKMLPSVQLYKGKDHIFDHVNVGHDVNSIFSPRVRMPSGGYLIFEQTEAMYVVDVNSGPYAAKEKQEDNSLKTNLEAAREIAKQLRLRDIGGIIVVDFIDLRDDKNRKKIYDELKKEFKKDRAKTNVIGMSDFGLVQITRQRIRPSVVNSVSKVCPMCGGSGSVVSQDTIVTDIESWISKFKYSTEYRAVDIYINPYLRSYLTRGLFSLRFKWMLKYKVKLTFIADETISLNEFKVTLAGSDLEITDVVLQGDSLDTILAAHEQQSRELDKGSDISRQVDYYSKDDDNGKSKRPSRPKRPARQNN